MVATILTLIVEKAQTEPHFSAMYAQLCKNLANRNKLWKSKILAHCQSEFEHDIAYHTKKLDERLMNNSADDMDKSSNTNATDENDREYLVLQVRKKYLGHVQFIGELFKLKLIKLDIMIWCLSRLLFSKDNVDEDDLECFARLMTIVGAQAESLVKKGKCHAVAEEKWHQCWDRVYFLTGRKKKQSVKQDVAAEQAEEEKPPKISSRIKFLLVDLLELAENGKFFLAIHNCWTNLSYAHAWDSLLLFVCISRLGASPRTRKAENNRGNPRGSSRGRGPGETKKQ
jgi:translation initiation factor 4G